LTLVEGATGGGKSWFTVNILVKPEWEKGTNIFPNFPLWYDSDFTRITRWHVLDDTYGLINGIILIDEAQKLLNARRWASLPMAFADKIAEHRHHGLDIISMAQDISHIDVRLRTNIHEVYNCQSLFRFPRNEREKPIIEILRVFKRVKMPTTDTGRLVWRRSGSTKFYLLSRYFTKTYYNTYGKIGANEFSCKIRYQTKDKSKPWTARIYSNEMINSGKARL